VKLSRTTFTFAGGENFVEKSKTFRCRRLRRVWKSLWKMWITLCKRHSAINLCKLKTAFFPLPAVKKAEILALFDEKLPYFFADLGVSGTWPFPPST